MPSPWKNPKTGIYHLRVRIPADLVGKVGQSWMKKTLGTKDPAEAKIRFPVALIEVQQRWEALRQGNKPLSREQVLALAGVIYRDFAGRLEMAPDGSDAEEWEMVAEVYRNAQGAPISRLRNLFGRAADDALKAANLHPDDVSYEALLREAALAAGQAALFNRRRAEGDFSPDEVAKRFPEMPSKEPVKATGGPSLIEVFEAWEREHKVGGRAEKTAKDWRRMVEAFVAYQRGHGLSDSAGSITPQHVTTYADYLRHDRKLAAKTINDKHLTTLKTVYLHGKRAFMVETNPAEDVAVKADRTRIVRSKGFTEEEARVVLMSARGADRGVLRWVPWIGAFTGARVGELIQLRREDFREESGIPYIRITPAAGSVKTGRFRDVPLHPQLVEEGVLDFVRASKPGPLFARGEAASVNRLVRAALGLKTGDVGPAPNHAWRHRFKTLGRGAGIDAKLVDAIHGHVDGSASGGYGEWPLEALDRAMKRIPRVKL